MPVHNQSGQASVVPRTTPGATATLTKPEIDSTSQTANHVANTRVAFHQTTRAIDRATSRAAATQYRGPTWTPDPSLRFSTTVPQPTWASGFIDHRGMDCFLRERDQHEPFKNFQCWRGILADTWYQIEPGWGVNWKIVDESQYPDHLPSAGVLILISGLP